MFDLPCLHAFHRVHYHLRMGETATWRQEMGNLVGAVWRAPLEWVSLQSNSPLWSAVSFVGYILCRGNRSEILTPAARLPFLMFEVRDKVIEICEAVLLSAMKQ